MPIEQLLNNIAELEKQLKGIKSATEQVNSVKQAAEGLVKAVDSYTVNADKLIQSVQAVSKEEVKEYKDLSLKEIRTAANDFRRAAEAAVSDMNGGLEGIKTSVLDGLSGISDRFGKKTEGVVTGFEESVRALKDGTIKEIVDTATRFTQETKTVSESLSSTVDKLKAFVDDSLSEPLDKDLKETVDKSLKPLVNEEMPKAFAESLVRMEESFGDAQKKIDEDWTKRQKAYDESVKKQQESIDSSVKQLKEQAETYTATFDQFKTSIEGLGTRIDEAKETTVSELRQIVTEQADKLNGELGNVINTIKDSASILRSESEHTRELISNLGEEVQHRFAGTERQHERLAQNLGSGFDMTNRGLGELGGAIIEDNKSTRSDIAGVFGAVKGNKPLLVTAIILLVIVIILQLAPMVLRFLK